MKKIIVIGSPGAGKSTFSLKLSMAIGIKVYHLDAIFWREDKTHITKDEFDDRLNEILKKDEWIIDGDYARTYNVRFLNADTIFFLDYPLDICLDGVSKRVGVKRPDMPWVEDKVTDEFKDWIVEWHKETLPSVKNLINQYKDTKDIAIFNTRDEASSYISSLK